MHVPTSRRLFFLSVLSVAGAWSLVAADKAKKAKQADGAAKTPERWEATVKKFEATDAAQPPAKGAVLLVEQFERAPLDRRRGLFSRT